MFRLYLVRHGVTIWNREGRFQGHTDVPLALEGIEQAKRVGERFAAEKLNAIWSSDLGRAQATAEAIAHRQANSIDIRLMSELRENGMGEWEGLTVPEIVVRGESEAWKLFRHNTFANRPPGSEPMKQVWARMIRSRDLLKEAYPEGVSMIVGHGGALRALLCEAVGAPLESMSCFTLDNTSVSLVEYDDSRAHPAKLVFVNCTRHLLP